VIEKDYFVRGCLDIPVHGQSEPFSLGLWVSLSKANFDRYLVDIEDPSAEEGPYFGWLCNRLPGYPETLNLKTHVYFRGGDCRPRIVVQPTEHPLAADQHNGITPDALQRFVEANLHPKA
jgi:hypothetical protein